MDHREQFGEIGSVVHLSKVQSHGVLVLSVRLSCIANHSQHTLTMDNYQDWKYDHTELQVIWTRFHPCKVSLKIFSTPGHDTCMNSYTGEPYTQN